MKESKYPDNWKEISHRVRFERAKGQCECCGECGLHRTSPGPRRCTEINGQIGNWMRGKVMLTVAHLDYANGPCKCFEETGKKCGILEHLKAMCQRCHLRIDIPHHTRNAARTRYQKKHKNQLNLFGE